VVVDEEDEQRRRRSLGLCGRLEPEGSTHTACDGEEVMPLQSKLITSIVVIFACTAFAARSGAAEPHRSSSQSHEVTSNQEGERSTNSHSDSFNNVGKGTAGDPVRKTAGAGGNSAIGHGINLVTPDYGYSDTSRRGPPLVVNGQKRDIRRTIPFAAIARPQTSPVARTEQSRNAVGVTIPNAGKNALSIGTHSVSGSVTTGLAMNSVGVSEIRHPGAPRAAPGPTGGINGTATHKVVVGIGTVGGPAKDQSVSGSGLRRKF
jgi:hypothetical protein